jgi:uncharacterized protein (DUF433 family)
VPEIQTFNLIITKNPLEIVNLPKQMDMKDLLVRITLNPEINHGKPCIRHTRYTVESILEYLSGGDTIEDILEEFKDLESADIFACLAYATASMKFKDIEVPAA